MVSSTDKILYRVRGSFKLLHFLRFFVLFCSFWLLSAIFVLFYMCWLCVLVTFKITLNGTKHTKSTEKIIQNDARGAKVPPQCPEMEPMGVPWAPLGVPGTPKCPKMEPLGGPWAPLGGPWGLLGAARARYLVFG